MEAMLDAAAKRLAEDGFEKRCQKVIRELGDDPVRAETWIVLCSRSRGRRRQGYGCGKSLLDRFAAELGVGESRLNEVLNDLTSGKDMPAGK